MNAAKINKSRATNIIIFCCHVLRFIVNVWTFTINTNFTTILLFFGPYDTSTMMSSLFTYFRFALMLLKSDKMGSFEVGTKV